VREKYGWYEHTEGKDLHFYYEIVSHNLVVNEDPEKSEMTLELRLDEPGRRKELDYAPNVHVKLKAMVKEYQSTNLTRDYFHKNLQG